jgi:ABC-type transporter Mla MlaB component
MNILAMQSGHTFEKNPDHSKGCPHLLHVDCLTGSDNARRKQLLQSRGNTKSHWNTSPQALQIASTVESMGVALLCDVSLLLRIAGDDMPLPTTRAYLRHLKEPSNLLEAIATDRYDWSE